MTNIPTNQGPQKLQEIIDGLRVQVALAREALVYYADRMDDGGTARKALAKLDQKPLTVVHIPSGQRVYSTDDENFLLRAGLISTKTVIIWPFNSPEGE